MADMTDPVAHMTRPPWLVVVAVVLIAAVFAIVIWFHLDCEQWAAQQEAGSKRFGRGECAVVTPDGRIRVR